MSNDNPLHKNARASISIEELLSQTIENKGCLEWQKARDTYGYGLIRMQNRIYKTHRLSAKLAIPNPNNHPVVMHLCDNPPCINPDHLKWGTYRDNTMDSIAKNRFYMFPKKLGSQTNSSKLTENDVLEIRKIWSEQGLSQSKIGQMYSISQSTVSEIVNNKKWAWLK